MTSPQRYIHGSTDEREVTRLETQAAFCAPWIFAGVDVPAGSRVLDLGCGTGAMAAGLLRRYPGVAVTGVDLSESQLQVAARRPERLVLCRADGTALPFPHDTFDVVHASWLLEHVASPVAVLREVRRVLRSGGFALFTEVNNASLAVRPERPELKRVWAALNDAQTARGGDPFIGPRLESLAGEAGFGRVRSTELKHVGEASDPGFFAAFVREFAEIFESVEEALPALHREIEISAAHLRSLLHTPDARLSYTPWRLQAWK